jgi:hypothetical protein
MLLVLWIFLIGAAQGNGDQCAPQACSVTGCAPPCHPDQILSKNGKRCVRDPKCRRFTRESCAKTGDDVLHSATCCACFAVPEEPSAAEKTPEPVKAPPASASGGAGRVRAE